MTERETTRGQCVSLVKNLCKPHLPPTKQWRRGKKVQGDATIRSGTAIAAFLASGRFKSGDGHAAIFIDQDETGISVWDQYMDPKKGVGRRHLPFKSGKGGPTDGNDGSNFYVIEADP
jgi:hypothetical protein